MNFNNFDDEIFIMRNFVVKFLLNSNCFKNRKVQNCSHSIFVASQKTWLKISNK